MFFIVTTVGKDHGEVRVAEEGNTLTTYILTCGEFSWLEL
jgi:hypothetical protein